MNLDSILAPVPWPLPPASLTQPYLGRWYTLTHAKVKLWSFTPLSVPLLFSQPMSKPAQPSPEQKGENISQICLLPLHLQFSLFRGPLSQAPAVTSLNVSLLPTHTAATASSQIPIRWHCSLLKIHQRVPARFSPNLNCLVWIIKLNMIWPLSTSLISSHTPALSLSSLQPQGYARYLTHHTHYHNRASVHCSFAPSAVPADGRVASSSCHHDLLRCSSEHPIFYLFIHTLWNL